MHSLEGRAEQLGWVLWDQLWDQLGDQPPAQLGEQLEVPLMERELNTLRLYEAQEGRNAQLRG